MGQETKLKINIILPFPATKPVGGVKIMYEYANRLSQLGHRVSIFHSIKRPFKKNKTLLWFKKFQYFIRGVSRPKWFALNREVSSVIVPEISDRYINDGDILFSTWWQMAYAINNLSHSKGKKFNLIQGYENWQGQTEKLHQSYLLPIHHIVIATYLQDLVYKITGQQPQLIPIAIDEKKFYQMILPEVRNPKHIMMLYSEQSLKGSEYGLEALTRLGKNYPDLKVTLFGVDKKPANLPSQFTYHQRPDNLNELYNQASIFISPSLTEGWALPPAEAMACGCALVCSDIGGHSDYAKNNETALLFETKNSEEIYKKIELLLDNDSERIRISKSGNKLIQSNFNWENSIKSLEQLFLNSVKK